MRSDDAPITLRRYTTSHARRRSPVAAMMPSRITRAVELDPVFGEHAAKDDDFAGLRERPDWPSSSA